MMPRTIDPASRYWAALAAGLAAFAAVLTVVFYLSLRNSDGHLVYALDDPYIHMSIARTLAQSAVWGVTPQAFTSASSSLLWTLLLSTAYALFGVHEATSLVLNLVCAVGLLSLITLICRACAVPARVTLLLLLAVILLVPLPTLILEGLEHVLQMVLDLAFLLVAIRALQDDAETPERDRALATILSPLVTSVRYEGGFLLAVVCVLFLFRRRIRDAFLIGVAGALPIAVFGLISMAKGWYFFPNSVLLKAQWLGGLPSASTVKQLLKTAVRAEKEMIANPHMLVLLVAALALLIVHLRRVRFWSPPVLWNVCFVGMTLLHLQFAGTGWFYRYESYLVALGLTVLVITMPPVVWTRTAYVTASGSALAVPLAAVALAALLASPLVSRGVSALVDTPVAVANIYQQQYQMGRFIREFYAGTPIAANDIGAVTFLGTSPILDLDGLATLRVAQAMRANTYNGGIMRQLAEEHGARIAILYDDWFKGYGIPSEWHQVGQWTIPNRVAASRDTVSFYAVRPDEVAPLITNLQQFAARLPQPVVQRGEYMSPPLKQ